MRLAGLTVKQQTSSTQSAATDASSATGPEEPIPKATFTPSEQILVTASAEERKKRSQAAEMQASNSA